MAMAIPGKEDYGETIRYWGSQIKRLGITLRLNHSATAAELQAAGYDEVILATGVRPRKQELPGIDHDMVLSYVGVLEQGKAVGERVAIVGAGRFGTTVVAQISQMPGMEVAAIADISSSNLAAAWEAYGTPWDSVITAESSGVAADAIIAGRSVALTDAFLVPGLPVDVVVEATGVPHFFFDV